MGVIGKVAGTMLKDNLVRNGVDLQIDSNLMYYDIANRRVGINTITPGNALTVNGAATISSVYITNSNLTALTGNLVLSSLTGNINVSNKIISYVAAPVGNLDATNKQYVDVVVDAIRYPNLYLGNSNTGNTNVVLNSETLNLVGNTNQINVAITENAATFTLASNLVIGNLNTTNGGQLNGYLTGAIGANVANTGAFTTATATGNISGANLIASGSGGQVLGYLTGAIGANIANTGTFTTITTTAAGSTTVGQLTLNGATSNRIDFANVGLGDPSTSSRSAGTKITLWPQIDGSGVDYAIGLTSGVLWNSVHDETKLFRWFANANSVATLTGTGNFTVSNQLLGYHTGAIGANAPNSVVATSITTTNGGQLTGYFNGPIGANTANTAAFTTLSSTSGNIANFYLNSNTISAVNADGNINLIPNGNGIVNINTTTALQVPVGTTFGRPAAPTRGMIRFNSAAGALELYDGFTWNQLGGTQTQIVSSTFTGDGSTLAFTLSQDATTSGSIVSINGITQIPDTVYTITGNVLSFTEAPVSTDIIEVRILTTTSSVVSLTQGNSTVYFDPANSYAIKADVNGVTKLIVGTANTYISGNLVTTNGITWPNGSPYAGYGTVQSIIASATPISGLSLSGGTITNSGTIALAGALDLSTAPAIGSTVANSGVFTSLITRSGGQITGYHNGPIGANAANTGAFTTVSASTSLTVGTIQLWSGNSQITGAVVSGVAAGATGALNGALGGTQPNTVVATSIITTNAGQITGYHTGPIGANTANSAAFTTLTATGTANFAGTVTAATLSATTIGNSSTAITGNSLAISGTITAATIGNATAALIGSSGTIAGTLTAASLLATAIGNASTVLTGISGTIAGTLTAATLTATTIGNSSAAGTFNTLTATGGYQGNTSGAHNGTIGATTANSGVFTTLTATTGYQGNTSGAFNGTIGATTANTAAFSTITAGTWNGSAIGVGYGGTGVTTAQAAINAFAGATTLGYYLRGNGTNVVMAAIQASDVPTLNQNTTGNAASATTFTSTSQNSQFNSIGVGTAGSGTTGEIRATNNVTAYYSDDRLKTKLGNIENALEKLVSLNGFNYQPNDIAQSLGYEIKDEVGVSAQEVQRVLPSAVVPAPIDDKYLTVHYDRLIPLLIEAIKELTAKVERLEGK